MYFEYSIVGLDMTSFLEFGLLRIEEELFLLRWIAYLVKKDLVPRAISLLTFYNVAFN